MRKWISHWGFVFFVLVLGGVITLLALKGESLFHRLSVEHNEETTWKLQRHLTRKYPLKVDHKVVAVVVVDQKSPIYEPALRSLCAQTYQNMEVVCIGNGIPSKQFHAMAAAVESELGKERTQAVYYEEPTPKLEVLYEAIHRQRPTDIIVVLDGSDRLAHEHVLTHLNQAYAHPDVWMTYSRYLEAPDYRQVKGQPYPDAMFQGKQFRSRYELQLEGMKSFYAGFFQAIPLQDFLFQGAFIDELAELAFVLPLVEMGQKHVLFLEEVTAFKEEGAGALPSQARYCRALEAHLRAQPVCPTLSHWKEIEPPSHRYQGDVIVFSSNQPLQLYATLESLAHYVTDIGTVQVIYEASHPIYERAYLAVEADFPAVQFLAVCRYPNSTFSALLSKVLTGQEGRSAYTLLLDDSVVIEKKIALHECICALEKVHADHLIIDSQFVTTENQAVSIAYSLGKELVAKQVETNDLGLSSCLSLCHKRLFDADVWHKVHTWGAFTQAWLHTVTEHTIVLSFCEEKTKEAVVASAHFSEKQRQAWAYHLIKGLKIDLPSLLCESEEMVEGKYPLIKRQYNGA